MALPNEGANFLFAKEKRQDFGCLCHFLSFRWWLSLEFRSGQGRAIADLQPSGHLDKRFVLGGVFRRDDEISFVRHFLSFCCGFQSPSRSAAYLGRWEDALHHSHGFASDDFAGLDAAADSGASSFSNSTAPPNTEARGPPPLNRSPCATRPISCRYAFTPLLPSMS